MPWLEERTLTLFVRDTEVRRYEPGVRKRGVDVDRPSGPLMGSADTDTDTDPDRALSLKAPVIHGHLIRQHFFSVASFTYLHLSDWFVRWSLATTTVHHPRVVHDTQTVTRIGIRYRPSFTMRSPTSTVDGWPDAPPIEFQGSRGGGWTSGAEKLRGRPVYGCVRVRDRANG